MKILFMDNFISYAEIDYILFFLVFTRLSLLFKIITLDVSGPSNSA